MYTNILINTAEDSKWYSVHPNQEARHGNGDGRVSQPQEALYRQANILALITIFYNILEGVFSVWFGFNDGTFSLFGFGLDSFVEVISGMGVWHMLQRIRRAGEGDPDRFDAGYCRSPV